MDENVNKPSINGGKNPSNGRFLPKNKLGKGNPHIKKVQSFRTALINAVTANDVKEIMVKAIEQAKAGDYRAREFVIERICGKITQAISVEDVTAVKQYIGIDVDQV